MDGRKREGKGSSEYESKRPRIEADNASDGEAAYRRTEYDDQYEGSGKSPYGSQEHDMDPFPLVKVDSEGSKKSRRYRMGGDRDVTHSVHDTERTKEHRKHKSGRERRDRPPRSSSPAPNSSHRSRNMRRNLSAGRNSPHSYEGRRSHDHQVWERDSHISPHSYEGKRSHDQHAWERDPLHSYQLDRDEGLRQRGDRARRPRDQYEGKWGSGAPPRNLHRTHRSAEYAHQGRSRSPPWKDGGPDRGSKGESRYVRKQRQARREESPLDSRHADSSASEDSEEELSGGGSGRHRVITLRHGDLEGLLRDDSDSNSSDSSLESVNDRGEKEAHVHRHIASKAKSPGSSRSQDSSSEHSSPNSHSKTSSPHSHSKTSSPLHSHSKTSSEDKLSLPYLMHSKFDSDDEEESGEDRGPSPPPSLLTGYAHLPSDEDKQDLEEEEQQQQQKKKEEEEEARKEDEVAENQKLSQFFTELKEEEEGVELDCLPCYLPGLMGCRNVECYEWLNRIEEGTYGVVHRAKDKKTGDIVALKKLKMEKEREGFPITSLREINMLLKAKHPNIVHVKEIVVGSNMDKIFIVMEYVEHDLKALMETMQQPFLQGEVKTLLIQLLRAVHHLHDNWILHRDLKASNLLLSHKGILKVGDFGLAREYGSPLKNYTPVVVTLWYRAPELLLGAKEYSTAVDMWSVGCIFAEFLQKAPLFQGRSEIDQINLIFKELGTPHELIWPGYSKLPTVEKVTFTNYPYNNLRKKFPATFLTESGFNLLNRFLTYDPKKRISALEALDHKYLKEPPAPVPPSMFPTWPAKSEMPRGKRREKSPKPPEGGVNTFLGEDEKPAAAFILK